jgi:ABC-type transport system involved in multi-copper enzyme maturation permease subunit
MAFIVTIIRLILLEAVRTRLPWLLAIMVLVAFGLAQFLGQVAIIEASAIQATLQAAILRLAAVFIVATFVVTSMVREASDKVTELLLSQAVPRAAYFFGKLAGYATVASLVAIVFSVPLLVFAPIGGVLAWAASLAGELTMLAAMSLFCVLSLTQVLPAISAVAGFYFLGRTLSAMQLIAAASVATSPSFADRAISLVIDAIALLLPSLDQVTVSAWLVSTPPPSAVGMAVMQAALYTTLIAAASLFDLYRKNI